MNKVGLILAAFLLTLCATLAHAQQAGETQKVNWTGWSEQHFAQAKQEQKLLILNLEAIWCHWCHVMEEKTYSNPEVSGLLNKSFINMKVDQDSRPDLSVRYRDYGWPATIIFNAEGVELRKLSGFISAAEFLNILQESLQNPNKAQETDAALDIAFVKDTALSKEYREKLLNAHYRSMDTTLGGLRTSHKYIDAETAEFALVKVGAGSERDIDFLKLTLDAGLKLIDPSWGGTYQYSTRGDWDHPHFEKIMTSQADNMRIYASAYALWGEEKTWKAATAIYTYIKKFMTSAEGAFFTSQDADLKKGEHSANYFTLTDSERRKLGIPAIDRNIYSKENGALIAALVTLYAATGNQAILDDALKAAEWVKSNRGTSSGGFKHGESDNGGPFLSDSVFMGNAMLNLYMASADKKWLQAAESVATFIADNFSDSSAGAQKQPGFFIAKPQEKSLLRPLKNLSENILVARFYNLLAHYSGKQSYREFAVLAMQYVATPSSSSGNINDSGILVADYELNRDPLHITVVGFKDDPTAKQLFMAGLKYFSTYKRLEWWDKREGKMPNPDVEYPQMSKPAAFICTNKRCSLPIFKPEGIADTIKLFHKDEK